MEAGWVDECDVAGEVETAPERGRLEEFSILIGSDIIVVGCGSPKWHVNKQTSTCKAPS